MKLCVLVLLLAGSAAADKLEQTGASGTPVERVVKLLHELQDEILKTAHVEQDMYDKFACWCETIEITKAAKIAKDKSELKDLGNQIKELMAQVSEKTAKINELIQDSKANLEDQKELTEMRDKEHAEFLAEATEMHQVNLSLEAAIKILTGAKLALADSRAFLQLVGGPEGAAVVAGVAAAVEKGPMHATLSPKKLSLMNQFLADLKAARGKSADHAKFTPASGSIVTILKELLKIFDVSYKEKMDEEASKQKNFEGLMATKVKELAQMKETIEKLHEDKAEAGCLLADAQKSYDKTEQQLYIDITFFITTKKGCEEKAKEYKIRMEDRKMELEGITKAIGILSSDEAREKFGSSMGADAAKQVGFLQVSSDTDAAPMKAFKTLKAMASKTHSIRLARLAATVRVASKGKLGDAIKAIEKVIVTLKQEEKEDIEKRDQCKEEYQKIASTVADINWKIEKNHAEIDKLEKLIEKRQAEKAETIQDIEDTKMDIAEMEDQRVEAKKAFETAKKDDEDSIDLIKEALEALTLFYSKNKINVGKEDSLLQGAPKVTVTIKTKEETAPELTFSHKSKNKNQAKGIVGIMQIIIEDLEVEINNAVSDEKESVKTYEAQMETAKQLVTDLTEKKATLETIIANRKDDKSSEEESLSENKGDLLSQLEFEHKIQPDCDWIINAFDERRQARAGEVDALNQAIEFLSGEAISSGNALLQKRPQQVFLHRKQ